MIIFQEMRLIRLPLWQLLFVGAFGLGTFSSENISIADVLEKDASSDLLSLLSMYNSTCGIPDFWATIRINQRDRKYLAALRSLSIHLEEVQDDESEKFETLLALFWIGVSIEASSELEKVEAPPFPISMNDVQSLLQPHVLSLNREALFNCIGLLGSELSKDRIKSCDVYLKQNTLTYWKGVVSSKSFSLSLGYLWRGHLLVDSFLDTGDFFSHGLKSKEALHPYDLLNISACSDLKVSFALGQDAARWASLSCARLVKVLSNRELNEQIWDQSTQPLGTNSKSVQTVVYDSCKNFSMLTSTWATFAAHSEPVVFRAASSGSEVVTRDWIVAACGSAVAAEVGSPNEAESQTTLSRMISGSGEKIKLPLSARWQSRSTCLQAISALMISPCTSGNVLKVGVHHIPPISTHAFAFGSAESQSEASSDILGTHPDGNAIASGFGGMDPSWQLWVNRKDRAGSESRLHVDALESHHVVTILSGSKDYVIFPYEDGASVGVHPWRNELLGDANAAAKAALNVPLPETQRSSPGVKHSSNGAIARTRPWRFILRAGDTLVIPGGLAHAFRARSTTISVARNFIDAFNYRRSWLASALALAHPLWRPPPEMTGRDASAKMSVEATSDREAWFIASRMSMQAIAAKATCCRMNPKDFPNVSDSDVLGPKFGCEWRATPTGPECRLEPPTVSNFDAKRSVQFIATPGALPLLKSSALFRAQLASDCKQADNIGKTIDGTFFIGYGMSPRHTLETLALAIFNAHTAHLPKVEIVNGGAEWWVQSFSPSDGYPVGFHFDFDIWLKKHSSVLSQPFISTVTYILDGSTSTDSGCASGSPTVILDHTASENEQPGREAWISWPEVGKHIAFDGRLLHGSSPELVRRTRGLKCAGNEMRTVLVVNVWLQSPWGVSFFPSKHVKSISNMPLEEMALNISNRKAPEEHIETISINPSSSEVIKVSLKVGQFQTPTETAVFDLFIPRWLTSESSVYNTKGVSSVGLKFESGAESKLEEKCAAT